MLKRFDCIFGRVEEAGIRPKSHLGPSILLTHFADHGQRLGRITIGKGHGMHLRVFFDLNFDPSRQGVNNTDTHPVQTAGEFVIFAREFTACVQTGQDQLNPRYAMLRMNIHRHTSTVVGHSHAAVGQQSDLDSIAVSAHGFVYRVVDHLLDQVIRALRVGVHAGATSNRFKARQDFNTLGVIITHAREYADHNSSLPVV